MISCLCVTEDRPLFMPWLAWNWQRQTAVHETELVVIDSSSRMDGAWLLDIPEHLRDRVRVVPAEPGTLVGAKRNVAMDAARGEHIAWMDDDDYHHPLRLERFLAGLKEGRQMAASVTGWFLRLRTLTGARYSGPPIFNSVVVARDKCPRFPEHVRRASDFYWMQSLKKHKLDKTPQPPMIWLTHTTNISNPEKRRAASAPLSTVLKAVDDPQLEPRLHALRDAMFASL